MRTQAFILSYLALFALTACNKAEDVNAPKAVTPDEARELEQAEDMLDEKRPTASQNETTPQAKEAPQ